MSGTNAGESALLGGRHRHGKLLVLGLAAILIPVAIASKSLGHVHKSVKHVLTVLAPEIHFLEQAGGTLLIFAGILGFCWLLGWVLTRTERGRSWLEWEKAKVFTRSPVWQKHHKKAKNAEDGDTSPAPSAQPALVRVAGDWQPGVIVEVQERGWATVFVPDVPTLTDGRLYCLPSEQITPLDTSLDAFRELLLASGHGSGAWLEVLAKAGPT